MKYICIFLIVLIACSSIYSQEDIIEKATNQIYEYFLAEDDQLADTNEMNTVNNSEENSYISADAINKAVTLIKEAEGFRSCVYLDSRGYPTIGYGHKLLPSEKGKLKCISTAYAEQLLRNDMRHAESEVQHWWGSSLLHINAARTAVLIDMTYNMGSVRWTRFTAEMKAGQYYTAAKGIMSTAYARQVGNRAKRNACIIYHGYMFTKSHLCSI